MIQWLRLPASIARGADFICDLGANSPTCPERGQKISKNKLLLLLLIWFKCNSVLRCPITVNVDWNRPVRLVKIEMKQDRGWDGWMALPTQWTWVWTNPEKEWRTGKPAAVHEVEKSRTRLSHWTTTEMKQTFQPTPLVVSPFRKRRRGTDWKSDWCFLSWSEEGQQLEAREQVWWAWRWQWAGCFSRRQDQDPGFWVWQSWCGVSALTIHTEVWA